MIDSFLKYISFERRYSNHTIVSYKNDLLQFQQFLQEKSHSIEIEAADHKHIRSWVINLLEKKIEPRSINRKIATLRSYYKFLLKREVIDQDPSKKIKALKNKKTLPSFVQEKDIFLLLDHFKFESNFCGHRDRLIFDILYGTGIRLSELIYLKDTDINHLDNTVKVLGKRNKERIIPLPEEVLNNISSYLKLKKEYFNGNCEGFLIVTDNGEQSYPMMVYRVVNKYLEAFSNTDKKSPHVLRHTFATHLLNKGADLNAVKELLGHASLAATQVYTHNSLDKLKAVFDQAHPKA
jgi:integrase/recombinase XerC